MMSNNLSPALGGEALCLLNDRSYDLDELNLSTFKFDEINHGTFA